MTRLLWSLALALALAACGSGRGGDTILAVDGDGIQVQAIRTCSGDCWEVSHGKMDLELRE